MTGILDIVTDSGSKTLNNSQSVSASDPGDMIVKEDKAAIDKVKDLLNTSTSCMLATSFKFNPFPHTTVLQQTTLNIFCQNIENLYN